jgi:hypothetical protein
MLGASQLHAELALHSAAIAQLSGDLRALKGQLSPGITTIALSPLVSAALSHMTSTSSAEIDRLLLGLEGIEGAVNSIRFEWFTILRRADSLALTGNASVVNAFSPVVELLKSRWSKLNSGQKLLTFENDVRRAIVGVQTKTTTKLVSVANYSAEGRGAESSAIGIGNVSAFRGGAAVGSIEGAGRAVYDLYKASSDLVERLLRLQMQFITGEGATAVTSGVDTISQFIDSCPDLPAALGKDLANRWSSASDFGKGLLVGQVTGYLAATVFLAALSDGATVELELASGTSEIAEIARTFMKVTDPLEALRPLTRFASRVPPELRIAGREAQVIQDASGSVVSAETKLQSELAKLPAAMANKGSRLVHTPRSEALEELLREAAANDVMIHSDSEAQALLDWSARSAGEDPSNYHAVTIGQDIFVRPAYADNVRVLREELIHTFQQKAGAASNEIVEKEIEARLLMIQYRHKWSITNDEIREMIREVRIMRKTGKY